MRENGKSKNDEIEQVEMRDERRKMRDAKCEIRSDQIRSGSMTKLRYSSQKG